MDQGTTVFAVTCIALWLGPVAVIVAAKRAGFKVIEVPTEWTDIGGSKVTATLFRSSLTMFLSVLRLRLVYSPLHGTTIILRPLEIWIYKKLRAPHRVIDPVKPDDSKEKDSKEKKS